MTGAVTLSDLGPGPVRLSCAKCGRAGQYRRETLIAQFGPTARLPDVLADLANCSKRGNYSDPCQAVYADLLGNRPREDAGEQGHGAQAHRHSCRRCRRLQPFRGATPAGALPAFKTHRREQIDPWIAEHYGRVARDQANH